MWARWVPAEATEVGFQQFENMGHRDAGQPMWLAVTDGSLVATSTPTSLRLLSENDGIAQVIQEPAPYSLSDSERSEFVEQGVLVLRSVVEKKLIDDALRHVNMTLAPEAHSWVPDHAEPSKLRLRPRVRGDPSVLALLYSSGLYGVVEELLGKGAVTRPKMAQIALRFPNTKADPRDEQWRKCRACGGALSRSALCSP